MDVRRGGVERLCRRKVRGATAAGGRHRVLRPRILEPEAQARARVSAALRKRFQRLKEPRRSPVPPPC